MIPRTVLTLGALVCLLGACGTVLAIDSDAPAVDAGAGTDAPAQADAQQDSSASADAAAASDGPNDAALEGNPPTFRHLKVFVSDATFSIGVAVVGPGGTTLAGRDAADALCASAATNAGMPTTVRAWLSSAPESAIDRLPLDADWSMPTGGGTSVLAFPSRTHIAAGNAPFVGLDRGASGSFIAPPLTEARIWSGTHSNGSSTGNDCNRWTTPTNAGATAGTFSALATWTDDGMPATCDARYHLVCFGY